MEKENQTLKDTTNHQIRKQINLLLANSKIIDVEVAKTITNNNEALMQQILTMFVESLPSELQNLQEAYQQQDWDKLSALIHKLNGGSRYCGAMRLTEVCRYFESRSNSDSKEELEEIYQAILKEIEALIQFAEGSQ